MQAHQIDHVQNTIMLRKFLTTILVHMHFPNTCPGISHGRRRQNRLNMVYKVQFCFCTKTHHFIPHSMFIKCGVNVTIFGEILCCWKIIPLNKCKIILCNNAYYECLNTPFVGCSMRWCDEFSCCCHFIFTWKNGIGELLACYKYVVFLNAFEF